MTKSVNSNLTKLQAKWLAIIQACDASGKSTKSYADEKGLIAQNLYAWRKVFISKGLIPRTRAVCFNKVEITERSIVPHECRVIFPNGVTLVMSGQFEGKELNDLLNSAMQL